jgi:arylsulfatase A-like enzyme
VLVVVDALRADHLGVYGSSRGLTPEIDRFASRARVYEAASATSAWTRSSFASLFTSRAPGAVQVLGRLDRLGAEPLTLAEVFLAAGWETIGVTTNGNAGRAFGFDQGFRSFVYPGVWTRAKARADAVTSLALQILDQRRGRLGTEPLFLFLHYIDPHDPYEEHPELLPAPGPPGRFDGTREQLSALDALPAGERRPEDEAHVRHLYASEVRYVDLWIGRLLDGLAQRGLLDPALIVLTADHGEGLWDHGVRSHGFDLYQEQVHVPLLVHDPHRPHEGGRIRTPVSTIDVAPTMLAAAGLPVPAAFHGRPLPRDAGDGGAAQTAPVCAELALDVRSGHGRIDSVRLGRHKLLRHWTREDAPSPDDRLQLFDLERDPGERDDISGRDAAALARLRAALEVCRGLASSSAPAVRVDPATTTPELREELRALGYVQ